jgi:protein-S-isoprenylcysteine O-methyltransferase Ste14
MPLLRAAALWWLTASWILFSVLLAWNHARVRRERRKRGIPEEKPSLRDPRSMHGLVLEGLGFLICFVFLRSPAEAADWQCAASVLFGIISIAVLYQALRHLGLEWRIKAVVTEDHHLVTTGPYARIRHPVFASLVSLLIATALLLTPLWAALLAVAVCLFGTEIRVRAEDGLLERRFGQQFVTYRTRVAAYLPFVR